jgi:hypothetical protein
VPLSAVVVNIVIGLVTSVLSGGSAWAWRRARDSRVLRRRGAFFGLRPGGTCLVVMNHQYNAPGSTSHDDVHVLIDVAVRASETGSEISVRSCDEVQESNAIWTAVAPGAVFTVRTYGTGPLYDPGLVHKSAQPDTRIRSSGSRQPSRTPNVSQSQVRRPTPLEEPGCAQIQRLRR